MSFLTTSMNRFGWTTLAALVTAAALTAACGSDEEGGQTAQPAAGAGGQSEGGSGGTGGTGTGGTGGTGTGGTGTGGTGTGGTAGTGTGGTAGTGTGGTAGTGTGGTAGTGTGGTGGTGTGGTGTGGTGGTGGSAPAGVVGFPGVAAFDALSAAEKSAVKTSKVFFMHQSVGAYMLEGTDRIGFPFADVDSSSYYNSGALGAMLFLNLGVDNHNAVGKLAAFTDQIRNQGMGGSVAVAGFKFCYSDIEHDTNLSSLQAQYAQSMTQIRGQFPSLRLLHVTPPVETSSDWNVQMNKLRASFGTWLVQTYGQTDVVFDLIDIESRKADGTPCITDNTPVLCNENDWSNDPGHPNAATQDRLAKAFLFALHKAAGN